MDTIQNLHEQMVNMSSWFPFDKKVRKFIKSTIKTKGFFTFHSKERCKYLSISCDGHSNSDSCMPHKDAAFDEKRRSLDVITISKVTSSMA